MSINEVGLKTSPLLHQLLKVSFILTDKCKKNIKLGNQQKCKTVFKLIGCILVKFFGN